MEYEKIISVTGLPGLYELINSKGDGAIVRSLDDKTTRFVSGRIHQFSHLESIEVFTERENVNLIEVFQAMEKSGEKLPKDNDAGAVKKYFEKVYPAMDFERVYASDMRKMVKWFEVLSRNEVELVLPEEEPEEETVETEQVEEVEEKKKPVKKTAKKDEEEKETPKKKASSTAGTTEKKTPAKKAAAKKKS